MTKTFKIKRILMERYGGLNGLISQRQIHIMRGKNSLKNKLFVDVRTAKLVDEVVEREEIRKIISNCGWKGDALIDVKYHPEYKYKFYE